MNRYSGPWGLGWAFLDSTKIVHRETVMQPKWRLLGLSVISLLAALSLSIIFAPPSNAHWADLSVAEITVDQTETQITLTLPTGLVATADNNQDGQLSPAEVRSDQAELQGFLGDRLRLTNSEGQRGALSINALETNVLPPNLKATAGTHSTLLLAYTWPQPIQGLKIHYDLFLPNVPTARCLATIFHAEQVQNIIFSPGNREFALTPGLTWPLAGKLSLATIALSFVWGAMHSLSPGHGKTVVGAYLVGSHATAQHALFLGLTTTIAHTTGVFALGLVTLFASQYILPEQLYPWLSVLSGLIVLAIGLNLLILRLRSMQRLRKSPFGHSHITNHHFHDPKHPHHHPHPSDTHDPNHHPQPHTPDRGHSHSDHSHLPPGTNGAPVTWRSLLALGISGGLLPCPSAMVVLLSAIALNRIGFGLLLVLAFSLGLAGVLTGLGLLLVYARQLFEGLPTQTRFMKVLPVVRVLPTLSALFISLIGLGVTIQALTQIGQV